MLLKSVLQKVAPSCSKITYKISVSECGILRSVAIIKQTTSALNCVLLANNTPKNI